MLNKFIVFTGLSGSGKTFFAKKLAKKLSVNCFDLDAIIEQEQNITITDIFATKGEDFFRKCEEQAFFNIVEKNKNAVISLGGGALTNKNIKNYVAQKCFCIYIERKIHKIYKLIQNNNKRPLLTSKKVKQTLKTMLKNRIQGYSIANLTINCSERKSDAKQIKSIVNYLHNNNII